MKRRAFIIGILTFSLINLMAQNLTIVNKRNGKGIENVVIYNLDKKITAMTNYLGIANIEKFTKSDTLIFQHPSYSSLILPFSEIKKNGFHLTMTERSINLSEIVISASKWEQNRNEIPNKITKIDKKNIEIYNPQTSADFLGSSNEVFIQKSQLGGGSPMIRGFSANAILLVLDGVRMNNSIYRSGNLQNIITIDPNIIENAEVIFGPGSIIYGSDAMGGVMDFHTKEIMLHPDGSKPWSINAMTRYSSANTEKTGHFDLMYSGKKWGFLSSVTFSDFDDLKMGANGSNEFDRLHFVERINGNDTMLTNDNVLVQKQTAYNQLNLLQKIRYRPNDFWDIHYAFHYTTSSDIPRYDRLTQYSGDQLKYAQWYYGPQTFHMQSLNIKSYDSTYLYDAAQISASYQFVKESRSDRKFDSNSLRSRTESVNIFNVNLDFDKTYSEKSSLFYGLDASYNSVSSEAETEDISIGKFFPTATRYPDGGSEYYAMAAYVSLKSNLRYKLTMTGGLRYSFVGLNSKFIDQSYYELPFNEINIANGALNGNIGLVYRPNTITQVNFNLSSGFRSPNVDDVAKVFDSAPGNVVVPNENLQAEYAYNADFGIIHKIGKWATIDGVVFYTHLTNAMVRRDFTFNGQDSILYDGEMSKVEAIVNAGKAWIAGGSITFNGKFATNYTIHTSHTATFGQDDEENALRHVPPVFGNLGLKYELNKLTLDAYINYNGKIANKNLAPTEQDKSYMYASDDNGLPYSPAWWTLNIKSIYKINDKFQLSAGIENILDKNYRPYSSGISAPGRNFIISLRAQL